MVLPKNLPELTGARFFAAMSVLMLHTSTVVRFPQPLRAIAMQGRIGVSFFFILSGFILSHVYGDHLGNAPGWEHRRKFLAHRFARVYPLHLLTLVLFIPIGVFLFGRQYGPLQLVASWLTNLLLIQVYLPTGLFNFVWNAPSWSIACEMVFYLLFPALNSGLWNARTPGGSSRVLIISYLSTALLFLCGFLLLIHRGNRDVALEGSLNYWVYQNPICRLGEFAMGCCLWQQIKRESPVAKRFVESERTRNTALLASFAWIAALTALCSLSEGGSRFTGTVVNAACWYVLPAPALALVILSLATGSTILSKPLSHPVCLILGEASYSLYMIHWLVWGPLIVLHPGSVGWLVGACAIIIPAAVFVHNAFERPMRSRIRKWLNA